MKRSKIEWKHWHRAMARKRKIIKAIRVNNTPYKYRRRPKRTKTQFLRALPGTGGALVDIAKNLGVSRYCVEALLQRPDWGVVRQFYEQEVRGMTDLAKSALVHAMKQRLDIGTASRTAQWYLSKVEREVFGDNQTVTVAGTLKTQNLNLNIDINSLNLDLETRRRLLEAMDAAQLAQQAQQVAQEQRLLGEAAVAGEIVPGPMRVARGAYKAAAVVTLAGLSDNEEE